MLKAERSLRNATRIWCRYSMSRLQHARFIAVQMIEAVPGNRLECSAILISGCSGPAWPCVAELAAGSKRIATLRLADVFQPEGNNNCAANPAQAEIMTTAPPDFNSSSISQMGRSRRQRYLSLDRDKTPLLPPGRSSLRVLRLNSVVNIGSQFLAQHTRCEIN